MLLSSIVGIISFGVTMIAMPFFIRYYQMQKIGGQQMHKDVKQHLTKSGTPTMGGTVFLTVSLLVGLIVGSIYQVYQGGSLGAILGILSVSLLYGIIGFLDDFLKIFKQVNEGLTPWQKMTLQIIAGLLFYLSYVYPNEITSVTVMGLDLPLGVFYLAFVIFWVVGFSNAVNLTDGIDGLASMTVVISLLAYGVIAFFQKQFDVLVMISAMIGGLLAFFCFNKKPAKIFMGDVGSLALGAMLAAISIVLRQEWTLLLIGLVYVFETLSVILQVTYFKYTKKKDGQGRRIFRMTPFHHHLELGGLLGKGERWSEWQVNAFMWSVALISSLVALALLYL